MLPHTPRTAAKGSTPALRLAGLRLAAATVEGLNPLDRSAAAVHGEAWKLAERGMKVGRRAQLCSARRHMPRVAAACRVAATAAAAPSAQRRRLLTLRRTRRPQRNTA